MNQEHSVDTQSSAAAPAQRPVSAQTDAELRAPATIQQALARLELSRERLRLAFKPLPVPAPGGESAFLHPIRRARAWLRTTPWGGLLDPALGAAGEEVKRWWEGQAWRQSAVLLKDSVSSELLPLVRRHPIAAVLITALAGAALARSGVWRWRPVRRSAWQIGSRVRHVFMNQIANPAIQSVLLAVLVSYLTPKRHTETTSGAATPGHDPAAAAAD